MTTLRKRAGVKRIHLPRETAYDIADVPRARIAFTIAWVCQKIGMGPAAGLHRHG